MWIGRRNTVAIANAHGAKDEGLQTVGSKHTPDPSSRHQLATTSKAITSWATSVPAQAKDVDVKDGEEGLAGLVARDCEVSEEVWDGHGMWFRAAAVEAASEGLAQPRPRRSIFLLPVLSPYHPVSAFWCAFMLLVDVVYTAFWVPLGIAFCTEDFGNPHHACTQADILGGVIYVVNLLMGFQCGLILRHNYKRTKVVDGMRVARYYVLYGRFWLDMVAVVPFIYLVVILCIPGVDEGQSTTSWVGVLSLLRLLRLLRLISLSKVVVTNTMSGKYQDLMARHINVTTMYTLLLVYFLAVIINLEACIILLIAFLEGVENSWLTSVSWEDFTTVSEPYQWYAAIYWVITTSTTTGYGDFYPHSTVEQVFANIYMICGMLLFGLLIGTIANALTRASASAAQLYRFRKKMSAIGAWLTDHSIPDRTQKQVKDYFSDVWVARDQTSLDTEIFSDLPTGLRAKVAQYITMDVVIRVHLLKDQDDGLQELVAAALRPVDIIPGHDICRQGEEGDRLWLCSEGELQALQHQVEPCYPHTPCLLGESVLLGDEMPAFRLRPWTLRASRGQIKLWELKMSDLRPILRMYPRLKQDLIHYIRSHLLQELGFHQGKGSTMDSNWCESVASMSAALLKQSAAVVETAATELQAASLEDGSLTTLLDGLLEFSTVRTKRITLLQPDTLDKQQQQQQHHGSADGGGDVNGPLPVHTPASSFLSHPVLKQSRSLRRVTSNSSGELPVLNLGSTGAAGGSAAGGDSTTTHQMGHTVQGGGVQGGGAACVSCGRAVCGSCRQVVRGGAPRTGAATGAAGSNGSIALMPPGLIMATGSGTGAPQQQQQQQQQAPQSTLLASMGLHSAARGGWRPVGRVSQRVPGVRSGVSTMSMAVNSSLANTSIPTENFGEGYGLWG